MLRVLLPVRALALLSLALAVAAPARAGLLRDGLRVAPDDAPPTDRIIVKWREDGVAALRIDDPVQRAARVVNSTGVPVRNVRVLGRRLDVVRLAGDGSSAPRDQRAALDAAVTRLRFDPSVEYAEADERVYIFAVPNDPRYRAGSDQYGTWGGQWYLNPPSATTPASIGAVTAWDVARGAGVTVAVIDTGVRLDHPDLRGNLLMTGRDFVCHDNASAACTATGQQALVANDGDGWDSDPSDPGDGITAADLARTDRFFKGCGSGPNEDQPLESSWHGTRVAGFIGAVADNGMGIAGAAPDSKIVPVRAIGKCTGYNSDLIAALYWAAGISDASLGSIAHAGGSGIAQVINLSLGNREACSTAEQAAIDAVIAKGILVVAAAGNDGGPIGAPANCKGVLSVAGLRHIGTKVGYSNVSSTAAAVSIAAPAGNCVNTAAGAPCLYSLDTLSNTGHFAPDPSEPEYSYTYNSLTAAYTGDSLNGFAVGTSFAAPLVSSVAALMKSVHPRLSPALIIKRMQESSAAFPVPDLPATGGLCHVATLNRDANNVYTDVQNRDCQCTFATCGAGMVNATAAVAAAQRPSVVATSSVAAAGIGQRVTVDGSASSVATGHSIVSYQWTSDQGLSISNANSAVAEVVFPALRPITLTLTITDEGGRRDSGSVTIDSTLGPSAAGGGGSGGIAMLTWLLLLLLLPAVRTSRFRNRN